MPVLILGLVLFLGMHSLRIVAPAWRDARYAAMGEGPWKGIYSLVSLAGFALIIWGYSLAQPYAPDLYDPPVWMRHLNSLLMLPAMIFLVAANLKTGRIKAAVKHPMLLATKLWAFGHLLANGDAASVVLFGAFLVWAIADRISVKRRTAGIPDDLETPSTSADIIAVVVGCILYGLFVWKLHLWLFGASPIAA